MVTTTKLLTPVTTDKTLMALSVIWIADRSIPAIKLEQNTLTAEEIGPMQSCICWQIMPLIRLLCRMPVSTLLQDASVTEPKLADGANDQQDRNGAVTVNKLADGAVTNDKIDGIGLDKLPDASPNTVLGPAGSGSAATPAYRSIVPDDLPAGTATTKGAVSAS